MKEKPFVAVMKHSFLSDPHFKVGSYDECVDAVHEHFLSYDCELKNGRPFDDGNDDGATGGYDCFSNVKIHNGKVASYTHCDGDGPVAYVQESK